VAPKLVKLGSRDRALRRPGKWKTHEDVEREMWEQEEAERRRKQGVLGKLKNLVGGRT